MWEADRPASASWSVWLPCSMKRSGSVMGLNLRLPSSRPSSARLCITARKHDPKLQLTHDQIAFRVKLMMVWKGVRKMKLGACQHLLCCTRRDEVHMYGGPWGSTVGAESADAVLLHGDHDRVLPRHLPQQRHVQRLAEPAHDPTSDRATLPPFSASIYTNIFDPQLLACMM